MTLTIVTRRPTLRIDKKATRLLAEKFKLLSESSAQRNGAPDYESVSLIITGDALISRIHQQSMGIEGTTDVLTLTYAAAPGTPATAEIFVNAQLAARCGADRSSLDLIADEAHGLWSPAHELALYIAHGFDHLAGNDDTSASGFKLMRKSEIAWVRQAHALGLVDRIIRDEEAVNE